MIQCRVENPSTLLVEHHKRRWQNKELGSLETKYLKQEWWWKKEQYISKNHCLGKQESDVVKGRMKNLPISKNNLASTRWSTSNENKTRNIALAMKSQKGELMIKGETNPVEKWQSFLAQCRGIFSQRNSNSGEAYSAKKQRDWFHP